jgi:hypothetical protein
MKAKCCYFGCNECDLVKMKVGQSHQTKRGFFTIKSDGWYCPSCGAGYGKFPVKPKQRKNIAMEAFPTQFKALRPENRGQGVKAQSGSQKARNEVYRAIAALYKEVHPYCEICLKNEKLTKTSDVHHRAGRNGLNLFDPRNFMSVCRSHHNWIGEHPEQAERMGLIVKRNL